MKPDVVMYVSPSKLGNSVVIIWSIMPTGRPTQVETIPVLAFAVDAGES